MLPLQDPGNAPYRISVMFLPEACSAPCHDRSYHDSHLTVLQCHWIAGFRSGRTIPSPVASGKGLDSLSAGSAAKCCHRAQLYCWEWKAQNTLEIPCSEQESQQCHSSLSVQLQHRECLDSGWPHFWHKTPSHPWIKQGGWTGHTSCTEQGKTTRLKEEKRKLSKMNH